jgi:hypothetical protein
MSESCHQPLPPGFRISQDISSLYTISNREVEEKYRVRKAFNTARAAVLEIKAEEASGDFFQNWISGHPSVSAVNLPTIVGLCLLG